MSKNIRDPAENSFILLLGKDPDKSQLENKREWRKKDFKNGRTKKTKNKRERRTWQGWPDHSEKPWG